MRICPVNALGVGFLLPFCLLTILGYVVTSGPAMASSSAIGLSLLEIADSDRSGKVDSENELSSISCEQWLSLDSQAFKIYGQPFDVVAGLDQQFPILGGLPVEEGLLENMARSLGECDLPSRTRRNSSFVPYSTVFLIENIKADTLAEWELEVGRLLVTRYSSDDSVRVRTARHAAAIECEVWRTIHKHYRDSGTSLAEALGLPTEADIAPKESLPEIGGLLGGPRRDAVAEPRETWLGGRLGLSVQVEGLIEKRLHTCGVSP